MRSAILVPALILPLCLFADEKAGMSTDVWGVKSGLSFEPNRGQTDPAVQYLARTAGGVVFFTDKDLVLHRQGGQHSVRLQLLGSDPQALWEPADATGATTSYYIGRDPKSWAADVPRYRRLFRRGVYRGVDQVYYGNADRLEYDFLLAPHADPARIRMRVDGATGISIAADGTLVIETPDGKIEQRKPILYETLQDGSKRPVQGGFRLLSKDTVAFVVAKHDRNLPLSIDPVLESSTYFGGSFDDRVVATNGSTTVGTTASIDFPGAGFSRRQGVDIFVSGIFALQQSTMVIGGSGDDQVTSANFGEGPGFNPSIMIGGYTNSKDLPTNLIQNSTTGLGQIVWQTDFAGGSTDGFLLVFTLSGSRIGTFLTYVGTPGDDRVTAVAATADVFVVAGSTNGSGLPTSAFPLSPAFQFAPAGGLDGFFLTGSLSGTFVAANGFVYGGPSITAASYFGGTGDDVPLAAAIAPITALNPLTYEFYIAGETRSADFPLVNSLFQRSGDSDGFLMHFSLVGSTAALPGSTLFGGSGSDRGVGLALFGNGNVALAGVTSSSDLPVVNPAQGSYGGGASDAFVVQFTPDLSRLTSSTYFGGSGADEATSIAGDSFGNLFVAGWTGSQDLPVQNALQPNFGGGPDDGFLLHFDIDGTVHQATYFGGSGSDRILGLVAAFGPTVWAGGQTSSPDLPLKNPTQDVLKGPSDGFVTRISTNLLDLSPIADGKDLRTYVSFGAGMAPPFPTPQLQVTVTSSDPSKVLVAASQGDLGQASVQAPLTSSGYFYVDCLVDQGGADVTLSSPGYVSRKVRASCFAPSVGLSVAANPLRIQLWAQQINVYPYVFVTDPTLATPVVIPYTRPGADGISAQITSSNPSVVTVSPSTFKIPGDTSTFQPLTFQTVGVGETDLQIASASAKASPFDHVHVIVGSPLSIVPDLPIPAGFQTELFFSYGRPPDPNATITITSQDPTKVALSRDPSQPGSGTVSFPAGIGSTFNNAAYVQALASDGDVPITVSVAGIDSVSTVTAHLSPPVALLVPQFALSLPLSLAVGGTTSVNAGIAVPGSNRLFFGLPNPGSVPLRFSMDSSSASVVAPISGSMDVPANSSSVTFVVRGIADGVANLNLHPPDGVALSDVYAPVSVVVKTKPVVMSDLELGKDLAGFMTLTLPVAATSSVNIKLTSSDPTLALLSPNTSSAGQSQIVVSVPSGSSVVRFYVYGFASTGQAKVTADVAGYGSISANVRLAPSGFAWTTDHLSSVLYNQIPAFAPVGVFALDAASLIPVAAQTLRPGLVASINYTNSNPDVVAAVPPTLTFNVGNPVQIVGKAAGDAVLTLNQPPGFSSPAVYTQLKVSILTPSLQLSDTTLAKDTQASLQINSFTNGSLPVTVTSSDPSRLIVSADPNAIGSASVTVPQLSGHPIYLQALDNQGSVIITASIPTYNDGAAVVHLSSAGVGLSVDTTNSIPVSGVTGAYSTTTQSPQTRISLALFIVDPNSGRSLGAAANLRPGVGPLQVEVRSSNVSAGTIAGSPAVFPIPSLANGQQPSVNFQPVAAGSTDVSVIQPPGFVAPVDSAKVTFKVTRPGFSANDLTFGKDTFGQTFINLPNNVATPSTNLMVTITSTDPTQVMLSPDQDTSPGPSVTRILVAGQRSFSFYIHALGNSGVVSLTITSPGYTDTTMKISLTDTFFYFEGNININQTIHAVIQNGPQIIRIHATPAPTPNGAFQNQIMIRPGVSVLITVNSSDSTIVRVNTDHVIFQGGTSSQDVVYQPLSPGQATLSLSPPPGYLPHPTQGQVIVNAQGAKLTLNLPSQIGRDLQSVGSVSAEDNFQQQPAVTITSSDPSRLLLSDSATAPGQASIAAAGGQPQIFVQSLADSGTITVTASANGYQSGTFNITLVPAAAVFQTGFTQQTIYTNSAVQRLPVVLAPLDPAGLRPQSPQIPRPGANLSIRVTSSDPKVLVVNTPTLQFPVDPQQQTVSVQPAGAGTAILSLGPLSGGVMPSSGSQIVFTVAEPDLFIPNFSLGRDLQVPVQVTLGSRLPTPTSDVTINVTQFGGVNLSNDPALFSFNQTLPVIIPAGQRASRPFYVQGSFTGATNLNISGIGYTASQSTVTVTPTAFVFQEASQPQPISISSGATATFNVLPVLSPLGTPALAPMTIRAGAPPINVNVASSNPAVLSITTPQITLRPGDQRAAVTVRAVGSGRATLMLSGAIYDFSTAQSSLDVSVK